jgi:hypothetical protein
MEYEKENTLKSASKKVVVGEETGKFKEQRFFSLFMMKETEERRSLFSGLKSGAFAFICCHCRRSGHVPSM